ncbi:MAG: hypothetical protein IKU47_03495 [Oscillospiraceae bacterium]|nr:hypothetical protein [Oscillospiraceae bacterium]
MKYNYSTRICVICGEEFQPTSSTGKCCSDECRKVNERITYERNKAKVKIKKRVIVNGTDWGEITRKCKEAGLSYGEAVAKGII